MSPSNTKSPRGKTSAAEGQKKTRKPLMRVVDTLLVDSEAPDRDDSWAELVKRGLFTDDPIQFGNKCGAALGLSLERESLSWALATDPITKRPAISGQVPMPISPIPPEGEDEEPELMPLGDFESGLREALAAACDSAPLRTLAGIGVAWPAAVDFGGTPSFDSHHESFTFEELVTVVRTAAQDAGFRRVPRRELDVSFINDADADLLYEARWGEVKGRRDVLAVKVCGRIGGALLQDGQIVRGAQGRAGEIGHLPISLEGLDQLGGYTSLRKLQDLPQCECEFEACVAHYASGRAIIETLAGNRPVASYNKAGWEAQAQANRPKPSAKHGAVFQRAGVVIGRALLAPALALDPECVSITAFPSHPKLVDGVVQGLDHDAFPKERFKLAEPYPARTAAGAARMVIEDRIVPIFDSVKRPDIKRFKLPWDLRLHLGPGNEDLAKYQRSYRPPQ